MKKTDPKRTSERLADSETDEETVIVKPSLAVVGGCGGSAKRQILSGPVTLLTLEPRKVVFTVEPGVSKPKRIADVSLCITI